MVPAVSSASAAEETSAESEAAPSGSFGISSVYQIDERMTSTKCSRNKPGFIFYLNVCVKSESAARSSIELIWTSRSRVVAVLAAFDRRGIKCIEYVFEIRARLDKGEQCRIS